MNDVNLLPFFLEEKKISRAPQNPKAESLQNIKEKHHLFPIKNKLQATRPQ